MTFFFLIIELILLFSSLGVPEPFFRVLLVIQLVLFCLYFILVIFISIVKRKKQKVDITK